MEVKMKTYRVDTTHGTLEVQANNIKHAIELVANILCENHEILSLGYNEYTILGEIDNKKVEINVVSIT